ncbi:glycosyltransferase [Aestuariivita sp.]|jgi:cellulose synthase/poly-beta-1,6-N-acetylglucosamine synthase-like glycosyltransferase|uniref:glycosyltransferase n=1 Tax=Aestuariivita sp. TaxID=1872407 RepID=UPI002171588A|nr:glycosyltransferase [Aestuariivita sp.]MCE8006825.1 glycosyltransferase [Aestuariivita sp.]
MSEARLSLHTPIRTAPFDQDRRPLGRYLVEAGKITSAQLVRALERQQSVDAPLGDILVSAGATTDADVLAAIAAQSALYIVDLKAEPPDPKLVRLAPRDLWIKHRCLPWMRLGNAVLVAGDRPDAIRALQAELPKEFPPIVPVLASEGHVMDAIARTLREELTAFAEARVDHRFSCRHWRPISRTTLAAILVAAAAFLACLVTAPTLVTAMLCTVALICLLFITALKLVGTLSHLKPNVPGPAATPHQPPERLPRISVMVPLFRETEIAGALIKRLHRLTYPRVLMDVILVLEEKDTLTREALARCDLPGWIRVVEVPDGGGITTKPRALNYALDFCRGEIIGIWDAEDAPAPDQLERVAAHFANAAPDVACLQGILDYYNPRANWLARCFTIEYASWFRVVLPGLARLGLVIPLGGTTLFLRRDKIHEMGGWDAHNVTEDADLGVRIARFGYRTELILTATHEEANCRPWRWVKQRSRWLKGFMVTYGVHMRHPRALLADIGWKRFLGLQAFFVGTLSQFLLAPLLWSFWLKAFALRHPTEDYYSTTVLTLIFGLFFVTELVNLIVALIAVSSNEHRFLMPWAVTLPVYFPLGALAGYKALYEVMAKPFYWDKTQHGHSQPELETQASSNTQ